MVIKIFKSNQQLVNVLAVLLLGLVWGGQFFFRDVVSSDFSLGNVWLDVLVGAILISFQAIFVNHIVNQHKLFNDSSHLPGLFIVLLNSISFFSLSFNQIVLANTFLIFAFAQLLRLYNVTNKFGLLFNAGILIGFASMFYMPSVMYFLFLWLALIYLSTPVWRDFAISLIGFTLPLIYYIAYFYVFKDVSELVFISENLNIYEFNWQQLTFSDKLLVVVLSILSLVSCFVLLLSANKNVARIRKMLVVVLFYFLIALITLFFNQFDIIATLLMTTPALAIIIANFFHQIKKMVIAETIFLLLIAVVVISYFS